MQESSLNGSCIVYSSLLIHLYDEDWCCKCLLRIKGEHNYVPGYFNASMFQEVMDLTRKKFARFL